MNRLLIIDDDTELCELLTDYLQAERFEVVSAQQAEAGLDLALSAAHDLVILDVMLPGMNGLNVLRLIRSHSTIPVLMLTARGEEIDRALTEKLIVGDICLDPGSRTILQDNKNVPLTTVEFTLLHELLKMAGQAISRDELATRVLERKLSTFDRSIDVHVSSLRKKLGHECNQQERIKTIRGVGYLYTRPAT